VKHWYKRWQAIAIDNFGRGKLEKYQEVERFFFETMVGIRMASPYSISGTLDSEILESQSATKKGGIKRKVQFNYIVHRYTK